MYDLSKIGLDEKKSKKIAKKLNELLANYQVFYINIRGFHWNIKGKAFFELHIKFEELYEDSFVKIDEIAERILTIGHQPLHSYTDYLQHASVKEVKNVSNGVEALKKILKAYEVILPLERELLLLTAECDDEGTNALMSDYIKEQEKLIWMYAAYLANE